MKNKKKTTKIDILMMLRRHLGQRTVLGVAVPVLKGKIDAMKSGVEFTGLTEKQIELGFRELAGRYIKSEYHSTYLDRRMGSRGFLELAGGLYRIRPSLLDGVRVEQLEELHDELIASLKSAFEQRQATIRILEKTCGLPRNCIDERHALVGAYLSQLTGNQGELFEVISFAVLREYFRSLGFSLQRFSTTQANDGGMDFVAGEAIYQVTVDESLQKLRRDLEKAPGAKRVLVRPTTTPEIMNMCEGDVLEVIELKDLLSHFIGWLLGRDKRANSPGHLQQVLLIALEEFRRENRAQTSSKKAPGATDGQ